MEKTFTKKRLTSVKGTERAGAHVFMAYSSLGDDGVAAGRNGQGSLSSRRPAV